MSMITLDKLQAFFFRAMQYGWASGNDGVSIAALTGWKQISFADPEPAFAGLHLLDQWGEDPVSGFPTGSTLITYYGVLAWAMWYGGGAYSKEAIPILRAALMRKYSAFEFEGGRGPRSFIDQSGARYINRWSGTFKRFEGIEQVQLPGKLGGSHEFWGGSLLPLN